MTLSVHPDIGALLAATPDWVAALERRTGRSVTIEKDAAISLWAGHASISHPG